VAGFLAVVANFFLEFRAGTVVVAGFFAVGTGSILGPDSMDLVPPRWDLIQIISSSHRESDLLLIL